MAWEPAYATAAELKAYLRIADTVDDALVAIWAETASRAVDSYCGRQFGQVDAPAVRTYRSSWDRHLGAWLFEIDDLADLTDAVVLDANALDITADVEFGPSNALSKGRVYTHMVGTAAGAVTVEALWGWSAVPVPVKNATLIQAARLAARRDSPFGVAGSPENGSEMRLLASLDPDLRTSLGGRYRRTAWAA
jgi:hypothetical protein